MNTQRVIRTNSAVINDVMRERAERERLAGHPYRDPRFCITPTRYLTHIPPSSGGLITCAFIHYYHDHSRNRL